MWLSKLLKLCDMLVLHMPRSMSRDVDCKPGGVIMLTLIHSWRYSPLSMACSGVLDDRSSCMPVLARRRP